MARRARDAGVDTIIVINLARVGGPMGIDLGLVARIRRAVPELTVLAGGGVRGMDDLSWPRGRRLRRCVGRERPPRRAPLPADVEAAHGLP